MVLPTNSQQTVATSNTEDMEVDFGRGHGLQGTNENSEGHEARVNKGGRCGVKEKERKQLQREQTQKLDHHSKQTRNSNDAEKGD
jgi:hypothetical protein